LQNLRADNILAPDHVFESEICILVKKFTISIFVAGLALLLSSFRLAPAGKPGGYFIVSNIGTDPSTEHSSASLLYHSLGLEAKGLSKTAFEYAYKGYQKLLKKKIITQGVYLTICDFSQSSRRKRLYVVDLDNNEVVMNTYVAHGKNSGSEYASKFSNKPESLQSSLGFYVTRQTYHGEHGLSLRMDGLEPGFNDKALPRGIVIHGANYIGDGPGHGALMGRSFGCPAVPKEESATLINMIKNGSCLFIYHPGKKYLYRSRILNG
jgi:hypothetical protein